MVKRLILIKLHEKDANDQGRMRFAQLTDHSLFTLKTLASDRLIIEVPLGELNLKSWDLSVSLMSVDEEADAVLAQSQEYQRWMEQLVSQTACVKSWSFTELKVI